MHKFLLTNKNALITGASSGIGRATAEIFIQLGANILITGRNEENLKETESMCLLKKCKDNQKIVTFIADLTKEEDIRKLCERTLSEFQVLDILVNNAGVLINDNVETLDIGLFDEHLNINLKPVVQLSHLLSPMLIESKGCIVNVSSIAGISSMSDITTYCTGKAALDHFTRCSAITLGQKGVRVNSINPGVVPTNIFQRSGMKEEILSAHVKYVETAIPIRRTGKVDEVAYGIAFLASPAASFIVGTQFVVDGGFTL